MGLNGRKLDLKEKFMFKNENYNLQAKSVFKWGKLGLKEKICVQMGGNLGFKKDIWE